MKLLSRRFGVLLLVFVVCLARCSAGWGWGHNGHAIVASIAEMRLSGQAKAGVRDLLGNARLADVASWADDVRRDRRETAPWHYVDIPVESAGFDEKRDGQDGNNVIDKVKSFEKTLIDPSATREQRVEAIKFLVHCMGDMHQPLHCAERNKDKGGNGRLVFFLDEQRAMNLHAVWDSSILRQSMGNTQESVFVAALNARISADQASAWSRGSVEDWANESHKVAADSVYAGVPVDGPPPKLDEAYVNKNILVVNEQLEKGGVRLATVLNRIFADNPVKPSVHVLAFGDWGRHSDEEKHVAASMAKYVADAGVHFDAAVLLGDNFYVTLKSPKDPEFQDLFESAYDSAVLNMPFYAALGNHDYRDRNLQYEMDYARENPQSRFKLPARWYRVDLPNAENPLVTFLMLDSNKPLLGDDKWDEQLKWMEGELARPRGGQWVVCCAHHTMFSNGVHGDNGVLMTQWGSLFRKYKVDFYFCGHDHTLQHLEITDWPFSYVVSGGGGGHNKPMLRDNRGPFSRSMNGFVSAGFDDAVARVEYYDEMGELVHAFERRHDGKVQNTITTASDKATSKPLKVIQGFDEDAKGPASTTSSTVAEPALGK